MSSPIVVGDDSNDANSNDNNNNEAVYEPRRSGRVNTTDFLQADGDTWIEKLMVCESTNNKLVIRSYFRNSRTGKRVWDEPPTGASRIEPATSKMRNDAHEELMIMQTALETNNDTTSSVPPTAGTGASENSNNTKKSNKKGKGFLSKLFGKKNKAKHDTNTNNNAIVDSEDEDMQRAISLSMGIQIDNTNNMTNNGNWQAEQEALELAQAISMSEAEMTKPAAATATEFQKNQQQSEDEMLQKALEESRLQTSNETTTSEEGNLLGLPLEQREPPPAAATTQQNQVNFDETFMDQKMPAKASTQPKIEMFDPYSSKNSPNTAAATTGATSAEGGGPDGLMVEEGALHKMDDMMIEETTRRSKSGMPTFGRRLFNKKQVEDEAGVV